VIALVGAVVGVGFLSVLVSMAVGVLAPGGGPANVLPGIPAQETAELDGRPAAVPDADPFYAAPAEVRPGDPLRYRRVEVFTAPGSAPPAPVRAWQVLYRSTAAEGGPDTVSATVLVPEAAWAGGGPRPVIGYGVSTHGLGDRCAPSYALATGAELEVPLIGRALGRGWAVVVTDYEGLGTPGDHTYLVARSEGHAVLDAVRAALRLPDTGLAADAPVGLWGYSQGGGAVTAAAEQVPGYAPELRFVGVAAGGVPADLPAVARYLDGGPYFGLVAAMITGFGAAYPELNLPGSVVPPARDLLEFARNACADQFADPRLAGHRVAELLPGPDPLGASELGVRFAGNRIGTVAPPMPVRLYVGQNDEFIPPAVVQQLAIDYCARGAPVQFETYPGSNHGDVGYGGAEAAVGWLADRFAGLPAPNTCGR
jgi:dienelactone hydrolase